MAKDGKQGGWLKRIFGAGGGPETDLRIVEELSYLNDVEAGLANTAATFILTGDPATVIASLSAQAQAISKARHDRNRTNYRAYHDTSHLQARIQYVLSGANDLNRAARYVRVLALSEFTNFRNYNSGSDKIPNDVQALFQSLIIHRHDKSKRTNQLTGDDVIALIDMLGGRPADLVDQVMASSWNGLVGLFKDKDAMEQFALSQAPAEVIEGLKRHRADILESGIRALTWRKIAAQPVYLDFLIDGLGSGSGKVRDAARAALQTQDIETVTERVIPLLSAGKAALRTSAIQMLGELGTEPARAALTARREVEKTQSIQMLLDQILGANALPEADAVDPNVGYLAADGSTIEIPERLTLPVNEAKPFGKEDVATLKEIDAKLDAKQREYNAEHVKAGRKGRVRKANSYADTLIGIFNGNVLATARNDRSNPNAARISYLPPAYDRWITQALSRAPVDRALQISFTSFYNFDAVFEQWQSTPMTRWIGEQVRTGVLDLRDLFDAGDKARSSFRAGRNLETATDGHDFGSAWLAASVQTGGSAAQRLEDSFGVEQCWPAIASRLALIAEALPPQNLSAQANEGAIAMLQLLPALPAQFVQPILFVALGDSRGARDRARTVLAGRPGLDDSISAALTDKRQAVRANAASFLAQRGAKDALPAIVKRLKTEKSEMARAAMISAVADLGGDTTPYLSHKALLAEATKISAKLSGDKLDWLPLDQVPEIKWRDGKPVEPVVIDAWAKLAVKLKSPSDGALFDLYMQQLDPDDAATLAGWLLTSWISYDTFRESMAEMRESVMSTAQHYKTQYKHYKDTSLDEIVAMLVRYQMQSYPNSGSDSKGILAMTHCAPPTLMAKACTGYLKDHGKRVSQAKAMIEVLAAAGTPEAIQVLVATSTRFKQRSVRELAESLVTVLANDRGWTADELADRSIPSGGLEDGGAMALEVGEELKTYTIRLDSDLTVRVTNPLGKEVKSLPAGKDAATKEAKALLSGLKKTVKTVTGQQQTRLYEAMMAERTWTRDDWQADLNSHPIMARLTERLVWRALGEDGKPLATFRPTPEGDLFDATGDDADLTGAVNIDLAHAATLDADARAAWLEHLKDFEVKPLFAQLTRPVRELTDKQRKDDMITDREGWLTDALKLRSATSKLGYDRGSIEDGAGFQEYTKTFRSAGIVAELEFSGSYVPEDNIAVAIIAMRFRKRARVLPLGDVPPLLLSECWNDLHDIAEVGAFDSDWRKKGLYT